jgi:hypothetical protein
MSASIHYKLQTAQDHSCFCSHTLLGLPGIPNLLPDIPDNDLHYCSSAIISILIKSGVLISDILASLPTYSRELSQWQGTDGTTLYPQMFLHPEWNLNKYVNKEWKYELIEIQNEKLQNYLSL